MPTSTPPPACVVELAMAELLQESEVYEVTKVSRHGARQERKLVLSSVGVANVAGKDIKWVYAPQRVARFERVAGRLVELDVLHAYSFSAESVGQAAEVLEACAAFGFGGAGPAGEERAAAEAALVADAEAELAEVRRDVRDLERQAAELRQRAQGEELAARLPAALASLGYAAGAPPATPAGHAPPAVSPAVVPARQDDAALLRSGVRPPPLPAALAARANARADWTQVRARDGRLYWYNTRTGVSQWEEPPAN